MPPSEDDVAAAKRERKDNNGSGGRKASVVGLEKEGTKEGGTAVCRREALICHTAQFALPFPYFQQNFDSSSRNSGRRLLLCMWSSLFSHCSLKPKGRKGQDRCCATAVLRGGNTHFGGFLDNADVISASYYRVLLRPSTTCCID